MPVFYTNVARDGNDVLVRIADHQGNRKMTRIKKFQPTLYLPTNNFSNVEKVGLHEEALVSKMFGSIREAKNYLEEYKDVEGSAVYGQSAWEYQFIAHKFTGKIEPDFTNIHVANVDIEVFSGGWDSTGQLLKGPFPEPIVNESSKPMKNLGSIKRYIKKAAASQEFIKEHFPNSYHESYDHIDPEDPNYPGNISVAFDPEVMNAAFPIPLIQLQDMKNNKYHIFGMPIKTARGTFAYNVNDEEIGGLEVVYHEFETEQDLLRAFLAHWQERQYDAWTGWNIEQFDCPYLVERIKRVLGEASVDLLSPWGKVNKRKIKDAKGDVSSYEFVGCEQLDYKATYQKHTYTTRERYSLDWIAYCELEEKKMDYSEAKNLNTLFFTDYVKYCRYGIKDVKLVWRLENKLKLLQLLFVLAYRSKSNYRDGLGTVGMWLNLCYSHLYEKGIIPKIKQVFKGFVEFEGAYVMDVVAGLFRWLISKDLNSLYPHIMQQYNLGPETIIEDPHLRRQIVEEMAKELMDYAKQPTTPMAMRPRLKALADALIRGVDERLHVVNELIAVGEFEFKVLKKHNVSFTPNIQFFRNDKMSFLSEIMRMIYADRKVEKATGLRYEQYAIWCDEITEGTFSLDNARKSTKYWNEEWYQSILELTKEARAAAKTELEKQAIIQDVLQQGLKILMNAGYGATGNVWFKEYFDLRISEAITTCGQLINKWNKKYTDQYLNKELGTAGLDYVVAGDTDSNYITLERLVARNWPEEKDMHVIANNIDAWVKDTYAPLVNQWCIGLCNTMNGFEQRMVWEREVIAPVGIWRAKKMYCMAVLDSEGVRYDKPKIKYKGLEARKSSTPEWCRVRLAECYKTLLLGTEEEIQAQIRKIREDYMNLSVEDVAKASSVSDLEKFMTEGGGYIKGAHFAAKAAINYNRLVESKPELELPLIESGDKVLLVNLKPNNPIGEDYLAFPDYLDPALDMHRWVDYNVSFEKGFIAPIQSLLTLVGWNWKRRTNLMAMMKAQQKG